MLCFVSTVPVYIQAPNRAWPSAGTVITHYNDVIMGTIASQITSLPFIQTQIKENTKAPRDWPLCGEFTGDRWIPRTNGQ